MDEQFGNETKKEMLEKAHGEAEIGPVVTEFQGFQGITLEINLAIEVFLIENLHWDLALSVVRRAVMLAVEIQIVLDGATGILGLLVLAGRDGGSHRPKHHEDGDGGEDGKEDGGIESPTHLASRVPRDEEK